jgi:hypothetical protein
MHEISTPNSPDGESPPPPSMPATTPSLGEGAAYGATLAFMGFTAGIVARDTLSELVLKQDGLSLAWLVCTTIAVLASILVLITGQYRTLYTKLGRPGVAWRVGCMAALTSVIYSVTFVMLDGNLMGAGLFDMIDYGLTPILTAMMGIWYFRDVDLKSRYERFRLGIAFALYAVGIVMLTSRNEVAGFWLIGIALLSPLATSLSDVLKRWLLDEKNPYRLTRSELLVVRFVPSAVLLAFVAEILEPTGLTKGIVITKWGPSILVAVVFGFGPLWLLCTALGRAGLTRLAAWEFVIPAGAFFITLPWHWDAFGNVVHITGALLVLCGFGVLEADLLRSFLKFLRRSDR